MDGKRSENYVGSSLLGILLVRWVSELIAAFTSVVFSSLAATQINDR